MKLFQNLIKISRSPFMLLDYNKNYLCKHIVEIQIAFKTKKTIINKMIEQKHSPILKKGVFSV